MNRDKDIEKRLSGRRYNIITFGCQMNEHDSEMISGMLKEYGCIETEDSGDSDITVINTCSIRENADKRFFGTLGQLKKIREKHPGHVTCVCGCMMQQEHITAEIKKGYPWVDVIFGTHNIEDFPRLLGERYEEEESVMEILDDRTSIAEGMPYDRLYRHKSFVNIMYGCNNFCTYCIVPYTRGREKSRRPEDITDEIKRLADDGVKEVTLLGQNVNSYRGEGRGGRCGFAELVRMIDGIDGLERIRFMTSHPKDLSDDLIAAFGECESLCHHIHLPVQSGSSRVLARMNRKYDREKYLDLVGRLRKTVPDITVTTDIIVGFPGETEEDFEDTLSLVKEVGYDSAFTFLYSKRKGTPAAEYDDQIPEEIKHERFERLVDIVNASSAEKNAAYVGRIEKVLIDGRSKRNAYALTGRTDGFKLVDLEGDPDLIGKTVDVRITEGKTFSLRGELIR